MTLSNDSAVFPSTGAVLAGGSGVLRRGLIPALLVLAAVQFWLVAWLSDDAMITLRQVERFTAGEGMVWNPGQRVQSFTHAAWFGILSAGTALSRPFHPEAMYYWTLLASALCWGGALTLWARLVIARGWSLGSTALVMVLPLLPLAIRDYTSSGLETPLSFLLAMGIVQARGTLLWTLMAVALLTRMDHAVQFGPLALWLLATRDFRWRELAPGTALLIGWTVFSLFYFGAPLPNTYYAKAGAGVPLDERLFAYLVYWGDAFEHLPVTLIALIGGVAVALIQGGSRERALAVGIVLHLAYLAWIGGDFMRGRFLAVDTLLAMALAAKVIAPRAGTAGAALMLVLSAGLTQPWSAPLPDQRVPLRFITDERLLYAGPWGLRSPLRSWPEFHPAGPEPRDVMATCGLAGSARLRQPDSVHIADSCGLTDPFLARLPALQTRKFRPGHLRRAIPVNYAAMILDGAEAPHPALQALWEDVQLVSRGPLTAPGRLAAIWRLQTYDYELPMEALERGAAFVELPFATWLTPDPAVFWIWPEAYGPAFPPLRFRDLSER